MTYKPTGIRAMARAHPKLERTAQDLERMQAAAEKRRSRAALRAAREERQKQTAAERKPKVDVSPAPEPGEELSDRAAERRLRRRSEKQ